MTICDSVQRQLAEAGVAAAEAADIARHLEGCGDCAKFLADLQTIEAALIELGAHDAPDRLVADTLAAVRAAAPPKAAPARPGSRQRWLAGGLAGGAVIAASLALTLNLIDPVLQGSALVGEQSASGDEASSDGEGGLGGLFGRNNQRAVTAPAESAERVASESTRLAEPSRDANAPAPVGDYRVRGDRQRRSANESFADNAPQAKAIESQEAGADAQRELDAIVRLAPDVLANRRSAREPAQLRDQFENRAEDFDQSAPSAPGASARAPVGGKPKADGDDRTGRASAPRRLQMPPESEMTRGAGELNKEAPAKDARVDEAVKQERDVAATLESLEAAPKESVDDEKNNRAGTGSGAGDPGEGARRSLDRNIAGGRFSEQTAGQAGGAERAGDPLTLADRFLTAQRALDGLVFQEPAGYWANTYIPGDPQIRLLEARLAEWDRAALGRYSRLEQDVQPGVQPLDAPADAALAVTLASDVTAIDGPTRLRVQIGLKGAERLGGRRPAMNLGLVVDLRTVADAETGARIRALVAALERARQPGDRFSLTVAGAGGGLLVTPDDFRHGPVQVALERMFNAPATAGEAISLPLAMQLAGASVRAGDDPQAVLGSSVVVLVTGQSLAGDVDTLERMAHDNAVAGVPLSVVSLAGRDELAHIDRLVAAGQGNRRILDTAQAADALVDRELHAASRAVARAVRLRIRLPPGVKLVSVLDSRRLGEPQAAQVREAEVSIDQRLARNLGIAADRGADEAGIQMVIPNFFAGDSHVVLLDVVAEQPGAVADVTVRYKDVVNLDNGVAQASLALGDTPREAGPLERNVLKNLVAVEFARQTRLASADLAAGNWPSAHNRLRVLNNLIAGLRRLVPGWQDDPTLAADMRVLRSYLQVVSPPLTNDLGQRRLLADSLQVAAHRKLQPERPR